MFISTVIKILDFAGKSMNINVNIKYCLLVDHN